ncbi:hypothetical protein [Paenibacillus sp. FSL H8-0332]|uniref:hypothetical protein n=1 Tax=Paenibacillus sp. FSL H8-0332 TaxID=2954742 RepID=UPI0030CCA2F3
MNIPLLGASIGASAALTAQIVSHWLTKRREKEKNVREIYQKLYAPVILDVISYFDIATNFRKMHDIKDNVSEQTIQENIKKHVANNLMYASPRLLNSLHNVKKNDYYEDFSDGESMLRELEMFLITLDELLKHSKKMEFFDEDFKRNIVRYEVLYIVWMASLSFFGSFNVATQFISYNFYFDKQFSNIKTFEKVNNLYYDKKTKVGRLKEFFCKNRKNQYKRYTRAEFETLLTFVWDIEKDKVEFNRIIDMFLEEIGEPDRE